MNEYKRCIAVDFDGVLFENKWPEVGNPIMRTIELAKRLQSNGVEIALWTCREDKDLEVALDACESVGFYPDYVNTSSDSHIEHFQNDPRKIGADEFWDDRALTFPLDSSTSYWVSENGVLVCENCGFQSMISSRHCPVCDALMVNFKSASISM